MKIPYHIKNSDFVNVIQDKISNFKNEKIIELNDLSNDGYSGEFEVEIGINNNDFEVSDYNSKDITRFPARIKAAATALKLSNLLGRFRISHNSGILKINKISRNLNLYEIYSREDIHSVFSQRLNFIKVQTWGNHGIIPILNRENSCFYCNI